MGSGAIPNGEDVGLNPSFVDIDHDLDVPEGIEGPEPVFVKPDSVVTFDTGDVLITRDDIENPEQIKPAYEKASENHDTEVGAAAVENIEDRMIVEPEEFIIDQEVRTTPSTTSCPICLAKIPKDIAEVYCTAKSVVKVAVRRLRKARLLLDLHASRTTSRLRSTIDLTIDPECTCEVIDACE